MKKVNTRTKAFEKRLADFLHTIGDNLYALRMNRKTTLKTVATAIKISPGRLSKIEKRALPLLQIRNTGDALQVLPNKAARYNNKEKI